VALQDDELALIAAQHVRGFVAGDVFAEALQDVALVVFDEGNDGEVDGGEVVLPSSWTSSSETALDGERAAVAVG